MKAPNASHVASVALHVGFTRGRHLWARITQRKEATQMKSRKWLIVPVTAAALAVGALGSISAYAETTPPAAPAAAEAPETTTPEVAEPNEPDLPGGGHADADGTNVDNQFDGVQ
jgi:hypothetical protein